MRTAHEALQHVDAYIEDLATQADRIKDALGALRHLKKISESFKPDALITMAEAVWRQSQPTRTGTQIAYSPYVSFSPSPDPGVRATVRAEFDDNPELDVPEKPTGNEGTNFQKIVRLFITNKNPFVSAWTLRTSLRLSRGALATILYTTHKDFFEKHKVAGRNFHWRLKPEFYAEMVKKDEAARGSK